LLLQLLCLAGLGLLLVAFWLAASTWVVHLFGTVVPGEVTGKTADRVKGVRGGRVQFTYYVKRHEYSAEEAVDEDTFEWLHRGNPVKVRVLTFWPEHRLLEEPAGLAGRGHGVRLYLAVLANVPLLILVRVYLREPLRQRALVRAGVATEGTVVRKEVSAGRRPSWAVQYSYRAPRYGAPAGGEAAEKEWQAQMAVSREDFEATQLGAPVTVLYDPLRPGRSLIYAFADYEAAGTPADPPPG
jgi:hypothetical protein